MKTNLDKWMEVYAQELIKALAKFPEQYTFPHDRLPIVIERMRIAFERGNYHNSGHAIKATCKHFGIKQTYFAINTFLKGDN